MRRQILAGSIVTILGAACAHCTVTSTVLATRDAGSELPGTDGSSSLVGQDSSVGADAAGQWGDGKAPNADVSVATLDAQGWEASLGSNDGGTGPDVEGASADASDAPNEAACSLPLDLLPDAAPNTCAVAPSDVACTTDADCTAREMAAMCGCAPPIWGVSVSNTIGVCIAPPCAIPMMPDGAPGCAPGTSGFETQDCQIAPDSAHVGVRCIDKMCMTYTLPAGGGVECRAAGGMCRIGPPGLPSCLHPAPSAAQDCVANPPTPAGGTCCFDIVDAASDAVDQSDGATTP
jgi:hypothetical protein